MHKDIEKILYTEEQLAQRAKEIGAEITRDYKDKTVMLVGVLKGSIMFLTDIIRHIDTDCTIEFVGVKSYIGSVSSEPVFTKKLSDDDIKGKHIILVEDILDSGKTLAFIKKNIISADPASVKICTLLDKKIKKSEQVKADYTGFEVDNFFVVGYGLDYKQKYRNLPYIGILKEDAINNV